MRPASLRISLNGLWSRLSATAINEHFLPNALVALKLGLARPCTGATIEPRPETFRRIGGFEVFADISPMTTRLGSPFVSSD